MKHFPLICWKSIGEAVAYYERHGFLNISVPWAVSKESLQATMPVNRRVNETWFGCLVGSAEQSFIELLRCGSLDAAKCFQATTPCFRDEHEDDLHQLYFMKTELFAPAGTKAFDVATRALRFHRTLNAKNLRLVQIGDDLYDLMSGNIELGSYGRRNVETPQGTVSFVYGTGLAEPRASIARSFCDN